MKKRLIFLGMAVFFAMVTFLGLAFIQVRGHYARWWFMFLFGAVFCILSLAGVFAPQKMQWLMDACKPKNED